MERISDEEYEKMTHEEQLQYWKENYEPKNEQDITSAAEALSNAFQDKDFVKENSKLLAKLCDGEAVNKNPLPIIPSPEMRLFFVDSNYFESIDELLEYCRINNKSTEKLNILDYYRQLAGRSDVIRKSNSDSDTLMLYTAVDEDGYGIYNNKRSIYRGKYTWEYNHGNIKKLYQPFRDKGIVFENDIYKKIEEKNEYILKYCRDNNLFNMGKK